MLSSLCQGTGKENTSGLLVVEVNRGDLQGFPQPSVAQTIGLDSRYSAVRCHDETPPPVLISKLRKDWAQLSKTIREQRSVTTTLSIATSSNSGQHFKLPPIRRLTAPAPTPASAKTVRFQDIAEYQEYQQDYHNITPRRFYLPPLQQHAWPSTPAFPRQISTHKTYTTRKGALLLYAEDMALTATEQQQQQVQAPKALEAEDTSLFSTFDDLRSAILSYGAKDESPQPGGGGVYLGFVHSKRSFKTPRTIRPGFSAKRYLSSWTKSWDDTVLNDLRTKGHIWDKNLFQSNSLDANLKHRISDDLSRVPGPYRLTKNMLMAPGAAGSYEFYRVRPHSADSGAAGSYEFYRVRPHSADSGRPSDDESEVDAVTKSLPPAVPAGTPNLTGTIAAIIRDKQNKPHAVVYSELDQNSQQEILQRLLMQSALHKQQQAVENSATMKALSMKSQQGSRDVSPMDVVTGVNDIDIGIAIETLVSANSVNLLEGEQVFDDHQLAEMYKSYFGHPPSAASASSLRKTQPKPPQKVSFPHHPTLPPIKKSPTIRRSLKPSNAQLPIITMEPAVPRQPKLSITSRRSTTSYSTMESVRSSSGNWASEDSNVWQADIDEDELLKQRHAQEEHQAPAGSGYDGDAEGPDEEVMSKFKSSSKQSIVSSKHSVAGSTKNSVTGSANEEIEGSTRFSVAGSTKQSVAGSIKQSIAGSTKQSVAGSISKHGSAVSLGSASMLLQAKPLSKSLDSLNMAANESPSLKGSIKGSVIPQNRKESMRSYKTGSRSRNNSGSGSALFDSDGDVMLIGSVIGGASDKASVASGVIDSNQEASTGIPSHIEDITAPVNPDQATLEPVVTPVKPDMSPVEPVNLDQAMLEPVVTPVKQDEAEPDPVLSPVEQVEITPVKENEPSAVLEIAEKPDVADGSKVTTPSDNAGGDDIMSMDSGHISADEQPQPITDPNINPTADPTADPTVDPTADPGDAELPSTPVQQSHGGSMAGSVQSIHVAEVGMDLPEAPSVDDFASVVKSRKSHSIPSVAGSVKSMHDLPQGDVDIMASFHNFSYESANNSRKNSLNSLDEDVLPLDGQTSELESGAEEEWPTQEGDKQISESEQEMLNTATESEQEEETDLEKMDSRMTSGKLSTTSGSVRSLSASVIGMSQRATPATQLIELEEHAAAVAAAVLQQRPQSGRDLAMDAQIATELWEKKLSELFVSNESTIERSRSAFVGRRRNSLDSVDSQGDGSNVGRWTGPSFLAPKPQITKSRRKRRVHSAKAAVRFIKGLLRKDSGATEENEKLELAPDILEIISNAGSIQADDIAIVEDHTQGKLIVTSRAPSAASVQSSKSLRVEDLSFVLHNKSRAPSADSPSERAISAVASENIPSVVIQSDYESENIPSVVIQSDCESEKIPSVVIQSESEGSVEMDVDSDDADNLDAGDVSRVPSVAELHQILEQNAAKESEDEQGADDIAEEDLAEGDVGSIHSNKSRIPSAVDDVPSDPPAAGGSFSLDVTNIGKADKKEVEKQPLVVRPPVDVSDKPPEDAEEVKAEEDAALQQIIQDTGLLQKGTKSSKSRKSSKNSVKSSKSGKSVKSNDSKNGKDETEEKEKEKEEFVVSRPQDGKTDNLLYKPLPEPDPKPPELQTTTDQEKGKKGSKQPSKKTKKAPAKKTKKKKTKGEAVLPPAEEKPVEKEKVEPEEKEDAEKEPEVVQPSEPPVDEGDKFGEEEDEFDEGRKSPESPEFIFIEDEFSSTDEDEPQQESTGSIAPTEDIDDMSEFMSTITEDSSADGPHSISNQQAKAAKRAAEKEKRRLAVERKRQEREDARRKAIEKAELQEQLKKEYEEEKRRKEEEIRMRKERQEAEKMAAAEAEQERLRQAALAMEKEKKQMEEYRRKMEEMARKKREENEKRREEEERLRKEEEERRKEEEAMMSAMEEAERLEYERRKKEEELEEQRRAEQERLRRELEAKLAQAEAEKLAREIARRQKEMERRLAFNRELQSESNVMAHSQEVTRMFTWSYFELLDYLGIAIPEELKEQYEQEKANSTQTSNQDA